MKNKARALRPGRLTILSDLLNLGTQLLYRLLYLRKAYSTCQYGRGRAKLPPLLIPAHLRLRSGM